MSASGSKLLSAAREAVAIAHGEIAAGRIYFQGKTYVPENEVAQASAEERERCALIAESRIDLTDYDLEPEAAVAESVTARGIADEIRKGNQR